MILIENLVDYVKCIGKIKDLVTNIIVTRDTCNIPIWVSKI